MRGSASFGAPVWRGQAGRTEVWYATFTDDRTGLGGWVHAETVAPADGAPAYGHGWLALFPVAAPPVVERFGPGPIERAPDGPWFRIGDVVVADGVLQGKAARASWDLTYSDDTPPLFTFPRTVWDRHLLPGAQIVPWPAATVHGRVACGDVTADVHGTGAVARIVGHGSAQRWGWLHAPLGEGAVLEIVTATPRRAGLRRLRPLAMVQVRLPGEPDWPANPALACLRFRTELRSDGFSVRGSWRGRPLDVHVTIPAGRHVALGYVDPDGSTATCTNSERADATITVGGRTWHLDGTAHAEVGHRPRD